jgi:polyhydroxyalkanoate synthesis repressor PhaR
VRTIKRYTNRRLYDTETSRYITLEEVKALVLDRVKIKVMDNKTNQDITAYVLLQIITELENTQVPFFTTQMLEHMIHFYGNPLQAPMREFLEKCFSQFGGTQDKSNPLEMMTALTQQNMALWEASMSQFFKDKK